MKPIGLIGGTSWVSTIEYYRIINEEINRRRGGLNFAELLIYSLNHGEFKALLDAGNWPDISNKYINAAKGLEAAGAACILLCAATPHKIASAITAAISIPLIHIADVVADELKANSIKKVALIGTKFTMEELFFKDRLRMKGIDVIIPQQQERDYLQETIFSELGRGVFSNVTRQKYLHMINDLKSAGAESVIFGCTEFSLLIKQEECPLTIIDPTKSHAVAAVNFSIN